jgi:hypothetical protein
VIVMLVRESGPATHRKVVLREDQRASFGRTEWADIAIPADRHLAPVHFRVAVDRHGARLRHLADGAATFLNGQPVRERALTHGDKIVAGKTEYSVRIEQDLVPWSDDRRIPTGAASSPSAGGPRRYGVTYERLVDGTEYAAGTGEPGQPPIDWLERISARRDVYLVVNAAHAKVPLPDACQGARDLLDNLPEPIRRGNSVHCVKYDPTLKSFVRDLWGRDALVMLVSDGNPECDVRTALGVFCRPSLLSKQLQVPYQLARLCSTARAVVLETPERNWAVFRSPHDSPSWDDLELGPDQYGRRAART